MHRAVAALRCNIFVERIPSDALHVMVMFGNLGNAFT